MKDKEKNKTSLEIIKIIKIVKHNIKLGVKILKGIIIIMETKIIVIKMILKTTNVNTVLLPRHI